MAGNAVAAVEGVDVTNSGEFEVDVGREPNKDGEYDHSTDLLPRVH